MAFKYGTDFFIGDIVTVIDKYGIQKNVRVLSAIESEDESGTKLLPQFNIYEVLLWRGQLDFLTV